MTEKQSNNYKKFIANRITELRMAKNISEQKMSYELGRNKNYISCITKGQSQPSFQALMDICDYFDISPAEFFDPDLKNPDLVHELCFVAKQLSDDEINDIMNIIVKWI